MVTVNPKDISVGAFHGYLLGAVTPRPIALASTVDTEGNVNLSPFSFFNCFGSNPPLLVFSPARRVRDNTTKHTYENVLEVPEVVIHVVNYNMVQQTSLASTEYPKGVNEFVKAGFTAKPSVLIKPPRVNEAPIAMECKVIQVLSTGETGGAGNLIMCEVVLMHIHESVLGADGRIDPEKLDVVARLGGDWYARIKPDCLFKVPKPIDKTGVGIDKLPLWIRHSRVLTGNDLGQLANVEHIPTLDPQNPVLAELGRAGEIHIDDVFRRVQQCISAGKISDAWQILLYKEKDLA